MTRSHLDRRTLLGALASAAAAQFLIPSNAIMETIVTAAAAETSSQDASRVLDHHLGAFARGVDEILLDYTDQSVVITPDRAFRGRAEIRGFFQRFMDSATKEFWDSFKLGAKLVQGDVAYITWSAKPSVPLATDTLVVRDGKIHVQTFTAFPA